MGNLSISSPLSSVVLSFLHLIVFEVFSYVIQVWELASYLRFNSQCLLNPHEMDVVNLSHSDSEHQAFHIIIL
jgi:hypothetical protein